MDAHRKSAVSAVWNEFFDEPGIDLPLREQPELPRRGILWQEEPASVRCDKAADEAVKQPKTG
jgi:hypothetical protein